MAVGSVAVGIEAVGVAVGADALASFKAKFTSEWFSCAPARYIDIFNIYVHIYVHIYIYVCVCACV